MPCGSHSLRLRHHRPQRLLSWLLPLTGLFVGHLTRLFVGSLQEIRLARVEKILLSSCVRIKALPSLYVCERRLATKARRGHQC